MSRSKSLGVFVTSHFFSLLLIALSVALCPAASAQSTAVLRGSVLDPSGAAVVHAKVVVQNQATGEKWDTQSDSDGLFVVPALPPGSYAITVSAEGFQTAIVSNLVLEVSTTVTQTIQLQVGKMSQQVTITAETPVIDNSTVTIGQVVDQKTVQEIPLNGRHFLDLGFLTAGSVTAPANGFLSQPIRGQGSFAFNTAGQREDTVNIMVNGINLNDMVQNQLVFQPSINTVAEFKVDNSVPSAEYGRNVGAVVNIATRSGTNDFHGEAFEFLRNSDLDARNFFNTVGVPQSTLKRNNFGAALGGPIKKDRAHFFLSYEGLRHRQGLTVNAPVLTDAQRTAASMGDTAVQALLAEIPKSNFTASNGAVFLPGFDRGSCEHRPGHGRHRRRADEQRPPPRLLRPSAGFAPRTLVPHRWGHSSRVGRHSTIAAPDRHALGRSYLWAESHQHIPHRLQPHSHHLHSRAAVEFIGLQH
jgi:hypothetical protein